MRLGYSSIWICFIFLVLASSLTQAQTPDASAGKAKFQTFCIACHGPSGAGDGVAAAAMNPKPRNLQTTTRTDDELKKIIKEGGPAVGMTASMPAWGASLNDQDIVNVVAYVRTMKAPGAPAPGAAPAAK